MRPRMTSRMRFAEVHVPSRTSNTARVRRTALYDRHVAAGAKLVDFAGWEMPVQYPDGVRDRAHGRARALWHLRRLAHGRDRNRRPQAPRRCCSACSRTTSRRSRSAGAQYSVLCDEQGGVIDDLFTYRLEPERYLTVTNASNHERDLAWFRAHAGRLRRRAARPHRRLRDARRPGPAGARDRAGGLRRSACRRV